MTATDGNQVREADNTPHIAGSRPCPTSATPAADQIRETELPQKSNPDRKNASPRSLRGRMARALVTIRRRVPPGLRLLLGLALIVGGVLGFLPVLGFWMVPLGIMVAALDIRPLIRWLRSKRPD